MDISQPIASHEERVLIFLPTQKDGEITAGILQENGINPFICSSLQHVCDEIRAGAAAAILTQESILSDNNRRLLEMTLSDEPAWSEFPLLVLTPASPVSSTKALEAIGHMTLVKRPLQISEFLSSLRAILRDRKRQYTLRQYFEEIRMQSMALEISEEQFRLLANSIPQLAWMADENGIIFWYNQRWYDYTGSTVNDMQDNGWQSILDPEDLPRVTSHWENALAKGEPWKDTFPLRRHDGQMRWHLSRAIPIRDENQKIIRWFGTNTDITEQQDALNKANAANIAKTEFLANMSHEIRTPMNAVVGLSSILSNTKLDDKQKQFVSTLKSSAEHLMALINDMLDFAKAESGMIEIEKIPFNLMQLLKESSEALVAEAQKKSLDFNFFPGFSPELVLLGDPHRIRQIISNLLSNSVKFTTQGNVSFTAECRHKGEEAQLLMTVQDTGIGMNTETQKRVFDKFTQADASTTRKYGGTGLGLAITKQLVELMGGTISLVSEPGQGSRFDISLPLGISVPAPLQHSPDESIQTTAIRPFTILLVEDYGPNVLVATSMLDSFGYRYDIARTGREALTMIDQERYDVVLMDIQMPELDGFETTRLIRENERKQKSPRLHIIAMTAHAMSGDRDRCLSAGMDDYISKPFNPDDLMQKIAVSIQGDGMHASAARH